MGNGAITVSQLDADGHPVAQLSVVPEVQTKMLEYSRQCRQREGTAQRMAPPVRRPGNAGRKVSMWTAKTAAVEPPAHKLAAGSGFAMAKWRHGRSEAEAPAATPPAAESTSAASTFVAAPPASPPSNGRRPTARLSPSAEEAPEVAQAPLGEGLTSGEKLPVQVLTTTAAETSATAPAATRAADFRLRPSVCTWFAPLRVLPQKLASEAPVVKSEEIATQSQPAQPETATRESCSDLDAGAAARSTLRKVYASCSQELIARSAVWTQPTGLRSDDHANRMSPAAATFKKLPSVASWLPHLDCVEEERSESSSIAARSAAGVAAAEHGREDASVAAVVIGSILAKTLHFEGLDASAEALAVEVEEEEEARLRGEEKEEETRSLVAEAPQSPIPSPPSSPVKGSFRRGRLQRAVSMSSPSNVDSSVSTMASSTILELLPPPAALPANEQEPSLSPTASRSGAVSCVAAFCQMHVCASSLCASMHQEEESRMPSKASIASENQRTPASMSRVAAFCQMHVCDTSVCSSMHAQETPKPAGGFCQMHVCAAAVCRWMH
eukprot:TRINITY_DN956_c0_g1_i1.p1 TRINITY_DN956_c0_g1~~TRINITY_DN956_c0_g1_i1.p1  ORF type:complete len:578 (+),score=169.53 TRINITY_DN956_c0_g1_i1:74-1735(+)